jgi:hypothetical protein
VTEDPPVTLAAEGLIDMAVLRRLVSDAGLNAGREYGLRGKGQLDERLQGYNAAAQFGPWFVARDLDHDQSCAPALRRELLASPAKLMCFRIVVRTVEAWLLADGDAFADHFKLSKGQLPDVPEQIDDAKGFMLSLLKKISSTNDRQAMVRINRSGQSDIGPEYNSRLSQFVSTGWRPNKAAIRSDSLSRTLRRIEELKSKF